MIRLAALCPTILLAAALPFGAHAADFVRCSLAGEVLVYAAPSWCDARGGRPLGPVRASPPRDSAAAPPPALPAPDEPTGLTLARAQEMLRDLGFDPGPIDGIWGPRTRAALERFMAARGLAGGDRLDAAARHALSAAWQDRPEAGRETLSGDLQAPPEIR